MYSKCKLYRSLVTPQLWALVFQYTRVPFFHCWEVVYFWTSAFFHCWQVVYFRTNIFRCQFSYRHHKEFLKTYSESSFPGGSVHIFKFFLGQAWAEKTHLESEDTDPRGFTAAKPLWSVLSLFRRVFSAHVGRRKNFNIYVQNHLEVELFGCRVKLKGYIYSI
jgi:hypothetical protein